MGYLINGDGALRTRDKHGPKKYYTYYTKSMQLRDDVMEIALKCGYFPRFRKRSIWEITFSDYDLGQETIPLDSKKYKTITKMPYKGKVWCVTVPNSFIITERNGKLMISGNSGYQSAQVGVETLIRRIEAWRHKLKEWCEEHIFKPIAEMQGFIDKEESEEVGETVYMIPEIKWNKLELKDDQPRHQILMQLHDKQVISTQTLCEELELNYDQEVKRMRYEQQTAPPGMMGGQMGAEGAGGMPMPGGGGGGMPGAPGGDMAGGGMPGMGMDPMGGMPGGMGGGGVAGAAPAMAAGGKVQKKGKQDKEQEEQMPGEMTMIKLTSIEQKLAEMIENVASTAGLNPQHIRAQFPIQNPSGGKPYSLDFAIPNVKLGIEADGEVWHSSNEQVMDDKKRDYLLAQRGWTILRFDDKTIDDAPQAVKSTIGTYLQKVLNPQKQASTDSSDVGVHLFARKKGALLYLKNDYAEYNMRGVSRKSYTSESIGPL